ncbi:neutral/alkaline ceramidase [Shewanella surugensis]|uniref:Neutral ceramidase n=1 Tax=Shewanella surugensis TaxID=212020 RepID=A0ABT0L7T2_9GAMM|nr:neutral/alkaline ceramidase [Shewanella surugensis]MCL1123624.1 neutral/alkaline ceramidase [Shewanella surugensis]
MKYQRNGLLFCLYLFFILLSSTSWSYESNYLIGRGIHDITGPAAEVGLMGYANTKQKSSGIHTRQWARAFIIIDGMSGQRVVFVNVDAGSVFQAVTQGVMRALDAKFGSLYTDDNVILSATHTHSAVGGQSHYGLYDITILGFIEQAYQAQVEGIVAAIEKAHNDVKPGYILINKGDLSNASYNRSIEAYNNNPLLERLYYAGSIQSEMTVLKFMHQQSNQVPQEIGMINWFATHPNAMGRELTVLSSDNKGYAAYLFERVLKGSDYQSNDNFVAAFAINNAGDMSPNLNSDEEGRGPTNDRFKNVEIIGERQYQAALTLYDNATEQLIGSIEYQQQFVDLSNTLVAADFTHTEMKHTCVAGLGESFAAGTEDGRGPSFFEEGSTEANPFFQFISGMIVEPSEEDIACHENKALLLAVGKTTPYPWSPEVLPLSIQKLGQLAILAVPAELTIMAGRRLMKTVESTLGEQLQYSVIAGLSNAYSGYVATKEEYDLQHYEGGSTHFGPWTLSAYQQSFYQLATRMLPVGEEPAVILAPIPFPVVEPIPRDLTGETINFQTGVVHDQAPIFKRIGELVDDTEDFYQKGEHVVARFWSGHPKNNLRTQRTFMEVQFWNDDHWQVIATDNDWSTLYEWDRIDGVWGTSQVTLTWHIPPHAATGYYRLVHFGDEKKPITGEIKAYSGSSRVFFVD